MAEIMKKASCKVRTSDDLPFAIQEEIMKRLPVKSLIQFRSASKTWKSLIDSFDLITYYNTQLQYSLVCYDAVGFYCRRTLGDEADSFPQHKVCLTLPPLVDMLQHPSIVRCSHGLLSLYGYYRDASIPVTCMAVLWNVLIRKANGFADPNYLYRTVVGFGVCGETSDPKIVKITHIHNWTGMESIPDSIPLQVEVFTLSTGVWRSPNSNRPRTSIEFGCSQVVMDGVSYWLANDRITMNGGFTNLIISFDVTSEEFKEISLPESLAFDRYQENLYVSKLRNTLVVLEHDEVKMVFVVWIMEDGGPRPFSAIFAICARDETKLNVLEFRKSGEPVIEYGCELVDDSSSLVVYDPYSKRFSSLMIDGTGSYSVYAYLETLLLLDLPDFTIYNKGKRYTKMRRAKNRKSLKHTRKV